MQCQKDNKIKPAINVGRQIKMEEKSAHSL